MSVKIEISLNCVISVKDELPIREEISDKAELSVKDEVSLNCVISVKDELSVKDEISDKDELSVKDEISLNCVISVKDESSDNNVKPDMDVVSVKNFGDESSDREPNVGVSSLDESIREPSFEDDDGVMDDEASDSEESESLRTRVFGLALGVGENFDDEVESVSICGEGRSSASSARQDLSQVKTPCSYKVGVTVVQEKSKSYSNKYY